MSTSLKSIRQAIGTKIATITGGSYTYDFSATGAVIYGRASEAPRGSPCCYVWLDSEPAQVGPLLCGHTRLPVFGILAFVQSTAGTASSREDAAEDCYEDFRIRFQRTATDRQLGGSLAVTDCRLALLATQAQELELPGDQVSVWMTLTVEYRETT